MSGFAVIYILLAAIVLALGLSFVQLYKQRSFADPQGLPTYVPRSSILVLKDFATFSSNATFSSKCLDQLVVKLTQHYHVAALYVVVPEDDTFASLMTLYQTWVFADAATVNVQVCGATQQISVQRGDIVTVPACFAVDIQGTSSYTLVCWSIHAVERPYKIMEQERKFIYERWRRRVPKIYLVSEKKTRGNGVD